MKTPRIVFLFSDTGGGHRSATNAIIEALNLEFPGAYQTEMIDIFREYAPLPLSLAPDLYPPITRQPDLWEFGYRVSDNPRRTRMLYDAIWPYIRRYIRRLVKENPCDMIVSVHPLVNAPVLKELELMNNPVPFVTVVTDMVSTHAAWYDRRADLIIVPTPQAGKRALASGLNPEQLRVIGQPVADRFTRPPGDKAELRRQLGFPDGVIILLVGGGEGMGPLEEVADAINQNKPNASLVIVAGRNQELKNRLQNRHWDIPVLIYGFVREMPDFMRAADVLVTKAGPGTISEAFLARLPIVLYSKLPGQEDGNVAYVVNEGAGVWAPDPSIAAATVRGWIENPILLNGYSTASARLARPTATREIARALDEVLRKKVREPVVLETGIWNLLRGY